MLPLLGAIAEAGGRARPGDVYDKLAEQLAVPEDVRQQSKTFGNGRTHNLWERHVRFARQTAILRGYLARPERSEEHTSELQTLMSISYAVVCLKKKHNTYI